MLLLTQARAATGWPGCAPPASGPPSTRPWSGSATRIRDLMLLMGSAQCCWAPCRPASQASHSCTATPGPTPPKSWVSAGSSRAGGKCRAHACDGRPRLGLQNELAAHGAQAVPRCFRRSLSMANPFPCSAGADRGAPAAVERVLRYCGCRLPDPHWELCPNLAGALLRPACSRGALSRARSLMAPQACMVLP